MIQHNKGISEYYSYCRRDLIQLVPEEANSILEIGCGIGNTGKALKEINGSRYVVGIDIVPEVKSEAEKVYDEFILANIENTDLKYQDGFFDCIMYGDVLEHLVDPWGILKKHKRLIKDKGYIVASIPNIRHYRIIRDLLFKGKFEYKDSGILDITHLRFFTLDSIISLFQESGYTVTKIERNISGNKAMRTINSMFGGKMKEFLTLQYLVVAVKK